MNIFNSLKLYASKYQVKSEREFNEEEKAQIKEAFVKPSKYGASACFVMVNGGQTFIPMAVDATLGIGEQIDLNKAKLVTLGRPGDDDIVRVFA